MNQSYFDKWVLFAVLSTLYSYVWDIKKDWNLGDPNCGYLRKKLLYQKPNLYYLVMFSNFGLRCMWVFTLSGGVVNQFDIKRESFKFLIYLLEVIRRCIWNILRMENEHITQRLEHHNTLIYTRKNTFLLESTI